MSIVYLSLLMRKTTICICENKDADQLLSNCEADQRLCFRCLDDTGYPHDGRADNTAYRHDRRADKRRYPHDREIAGEIDIQMSRNGYILSW